MEPWLSEDEKNRAVLVRNLGPETTDGALEDFFSFCGAVDSQNLFMDRDEAVVIFSDVDGRQAALLINGGKLQDVTITISPVPDDYTPEKGSEEQASTRETAEKVDEDGIPVVSAEDVLGDDAPVRSKTVPASSTGGLFGSSGDWFSSVKKTLNEVQQEYSEVAKEIGEEYSTVTREINTSIRDKWNDPNLQETLSSVRRKASESASQTRTKLQELDESYDISGKSRGVAVKSRDAAVNVSKKVDSTLGISTAAASVADASTVVAREVDENYRISETTRRLASQALDNETIRNGVRSFSVGWNSLKSKLSTTMADNSLLQPAHEDSDDDMPPDQPFGAQRTSAVPPTNPEDSSGTATDAESGRNPLGVD